MFAWGWKTTLISKYWFPLTRERRRQRKWLKGWPYAMLPSFCCYCCLVTKLCLTLLRPPWTIAPRLPHPWDFPGKNTRAVCHFLLQGIFPTQGLNLCLLYWQEDSLPPSHLGNSYYHLNSTKWHLCWMAFTSFYYPEEMSETSIIWGEC